MTKRHCHNCDRYFKLNEFIQHWDKCRERRRWKAKKNKHHTKEKIK